MAKAIHLFLEMFPVLWLGSVSVYLVKKVPKAASLLQFATDS